MLLLEEYRFIKAFGSGKPYDEFEANELQSLIALDAHINEVEVECQELNKKWQNRR